MISIQRYGELGTMQNSWLNAHYHFSFSNYHNPKRMGFGPLRVINDDIVKAGSGFDFHSHKNMEIITYVRKGAITHRDNLGHVGKTSAGDVQVMSAGTGITHAEHNLENVDTNLYQIWIEPNAMNVMPRWEARAFEQSPVTDRLHLLVSGLPEHSTSGALFIHADAAIYGGVLVNNATITQPLTKAGYLLVSDGEIELNGHKLSRGDGAEILDEPSLAIRAQSNAEIVLIDIPKL